MTESHKKWLKDEKLKKHEIRNNVYSTEIGSGFSLVFLTSIFYSVQLCNLLFRQSHFLWLFEQIIQMT